LFQASVLTLFVQDEQLRDVTPKIMTLIKGRIEQLILHISRLAPSDPNLKTLSNMANVAGRIAETVRNGRNRENLY
jgi:predicted type IV restriction endonuclease